MALFVTGMTTEALENTGEVDAVSHTTSYMPIDTQPPISRLPSETLTEIFAYLPLSIHELKEYRQAGTFPRWLAVTHVSQHWRRDAYACRDLWAYIPLESVEWTRVALQHSNPIPIIIDVDTLDVARDYIQPDAVLLAFDSLARASEVNLTEERGLPTVQLIKHLTNSRLPFLKSLKTFVTPISERIPVPAIFFHAQYLPSLRHLDIVGATNFLTMSSFSPPSSLTSLSLMDFACLWATTAEMVETLRLLPNLQELSIQDCLPDIDSLDVTPVEFACLTHLSLGGGVLSLSWATRLIYAPACLILELEPVLDYEEHTVPELVGLVQAMLYPHVKTAVDAGVSYHTLTLLHMDEDGETHVHLTVDPSSQRSGGTGSVHLSLHHMNWGANEERAAEEAGVIARAVLSCLPLSGVRVLNIGTAIIKASTWTSILPQVLEVSAKGAAACDLLKLLYDVHSRAHADIPPPLPSLELLVIFEVDFEDIADGFSPFEASLSVLAARWEGPYPACHLALHGCKVTPDDVDALTDIIGDDLLWCRAPQQSVSSPLEDAE
ncbi:hypothetical protein BV25DRAFT_1417166 [Artomyces pyxidatus]|uniref:Uncharacterized protein n=1 Tax=Artomyces pyxidatus TaxID=48021 RepID=A0ACB8TE46_9AGAM|nr:hypothetical protein BV25DRAFT_1417166 [Artomyces pyxidatus]